MTYLSGKAHKRKKTIRYSIYGLLFVLLVVLWQPFRKVTNPILEPIIMLYSDSKDYLGTIPNFFVTYGTSHKVLVAYNKQLEVDIERLENMVAERDAELKELKFINEEATKPEITLSL